MMRPYLVAEPVPPESDLVPGVPLPVATALLRQLAHMLRCHLAEVQQAMLAAAAGAAVEDGSEAGASRFATSVWPDLEQTLHMLREGSTLAGKCPREACVSTPASGHNVRPSGIVPAQSLRVGAPAQHL